MKADCVLDCHQDVLLIFGMAQDFADKSAARQWVWDRLGAEGVARFPFPPHGRIPNFAGDSPLEEAGFEPSVPRQGAAFFTEENELYPLPINHQAGDRASGEKRLSRGRRNRCQRLRSLH